MGQWIRRYIPSAFTLANLYLGLLAVYLVLDGRWRTASFVIILGMFMDGLDGRLARLLDVTSNFGKELDSLADVVTFGVAPSVLLVSLGRTEWYYHLAAAAFVFCGAIRLARFNSQPPALTGHFTGLPITAAGGIASTATLYKEFYPSYILPAAFIALAVLMVSRVPYPDFKGLTLPRSSAILIVSIIATAFLLWFARNLVFIPLVLYALFGLGWHGLVWRRLPTAWKVKYEAQKARTLKRRLEKRARKAEQRAHREQKRAQKN